MTPRQNITDRRMLDLAARVALRGAGDVEPNPLVGCVIGRMEQGAVRVLGLGHHRQFGNVHGEVDALESCRRSGFDPRGATAWVTLEPCAHHGKTPPCAQAFVDAGIAEVIIARRDTNEIASGGAELLRSAGVAVRFTDASVAAQRLSDAFFKRVKTGLPWVIAKWAQTIDGRLATRTGDSKWISNERSRRDVHRLRARVDAIVTGIGTVKADDPDLTSRNVRRVRRVAARIVVDPDFELPPTSQLAASAKRAPVIAWTTERALNANPDRAAALRTAGVEIQAQPTEGAVLDLRVCLAQLTKERDAMRVLVEAGPGLLGSLFEQDLVDELRVYVAPLALADDAALPALRGRECLLMNDATRFDLIHTRRFGDDVLLQYRTRANR